MMLTVRRLFCLLACNAAALGFVVASAGGAAAAATITVTPHDNLTDGQVVKVSGSGFAPGGAGAIVECNPDPTAPTVAVPGSPQPVPVGCSNPLTHVVSFDGSGNLASTDFPVKKGTVGPPASGTDSAGHDAAADAANYPCPPTADQQSKYGNCVIAVGDSAGARGTQGITFAQATTTTTAATTATTAATTATTAATTAATNPPVVQQTTATTAAPSLSRTGSSQRLIALAIGAVIVLDAGYMLFSATRRPRPLFRRRS